MAYVDSSFNVMSSSVDLRPAGPGTDVLSDVLRSVRLEGTLYFEAQLTQPWGIHITNSGMSNFHHITSGSCWVSTESGQISAGSPVGRRPGEKGSWIHLGPGETIVFPHGAAHTLSHSPGDRTIEGKAMFQHMDDDRVVRLGGDGPETTILCGHFDYDRDLSHPLLHALPDVIHGEADRYPSWTNLAQLAATRSKGGGPGAQALTDRLAEVLLIELVSDLDKHLDQQPGQHRGFVQALADPVVSAALKAIHDDPTRDWTVADLAHHVAASRSLLAARFVELVGETPIRYLTRWRMHEAARLLRDTGLSVSRVAAHAGYGTPFSFSRAFTRELGMPPSAYRDRVPARAGA